MAFQDLPDTYRQSLTQVKTWALEVRSHLAQANPDARRLQSQFLTLQQGFQTQVLPLVGDELPPALQTDWVSGQTEINRQLRLMGMDVAWLQTARQAITVQQRQAQMCDRIDSILGFCQTLLAEPELEDGV